jgi:hypothetical protein
VVDADEQVLGNVQGSGHLPIIVQRAVGLNAV